MNLVLYQVGMQANALILASQLCYLHHQAVPNLKEQKRFLNDRPQNANLVFCQVGVQADALILAGELCGLNHQVVGHCEGGAGGQTHTQHGVPMATQQIQI